MAPETRSFGTEISGNREKNHEFTPEQRSAMVAELYAGKSYRDVAKDYGTDPGTVYRTKRRWQQHHYNHSRPREGRPKKLTAIQIIRINSFINRHRHLTWNDLISELDLSISTRTLQRRLQSHWRRKWRSKRRIALSEDEAKERLEFAQYWIPRIDELLLACFTDECIVQNAPNNPDGWVFRRPDEKLRKDLVNVQHHGKPRQSIMVWAGIAGKKKTSLIVLTRDPEAKRNGYSSWSYIKALTEGLLPFIDEFGPFQQDNAPIHTSKMSMDWLLLHGIRPIIWPTHSPDLNPIEHLWKALKSKLRRLHPEFTRLGKSQADTEKMVAWIKEAWDALDPDLVKKLTKSMKRRLHAVRRAKGWYTKY